MKTVLVTGASGFLGHHLVQELLKQNDTKVIGILGRPEDKANALPDSSNLSIHPCTSLLNTDFGHVDTLIHTAFSRGDNLPGLTRSIELTEQIIDLVNKQDIESIINISSQGVYKGQKPGEKVDENGCIEPNTAYGLAKWAVENMLKVGCKKFFTSIRMASLSANARFLDLFVDSVISGKSITVTAPNQYASIMDVKDAVAGIVAVESLSPNKREPVFNMGPGVQYSILDYAKSANEIGQTFGCPSIIVKVEDSGKEFATCMDCQKLISLTGWNRSITKDMMLHDLFQSKIKQL